MGFDSKNLLVGAFVANARAAGLTASERQVASASVMDVLRDGGLACLSPAPEPLAEPNLNTVLLV